MADRRMFSKRIISSARFLKMPVSTQCLYFHLGLNADDDGIVEAYMTMNLVGATEDDLKILVAKNFVQVLNDDLVTYITDWKENNKIRADRKVDSIYKDLLLQVNPDVQLLQSKPRADRKKDVGTSHGQPNDNQRTDNGQHRIGKDRIGEVSIDNIHTQEKSVSEYVSDNLSSMTRLYEENIGPIYPASRDWFIEVSETIDVDLFKRAIEICIDRGNVTPGYLKGIIKKWIDGKIFTYKALKAKEMESKNAKNKNSKIIELKPSQSNSNDDVTEEELEALRKLQEESGVF